VNYNEIRLNARIIEKGELRYTPGGIPVIDLKLAHSSSQMEAGVKRQIELQIDAVAMKELAQRLVNVEINTVANFFGFMAHKSKSYSQLILHIQNLELEKGI
jgi:primosomal replication protein N